MAEKVIASISYIRTVSKKKATIEKILAHLSKSEICDKTWSTKSLKYYFLTWLLKAKLNFLIAAIR